MMGHDFSSVCIFCGASLGQRPIYAEMAQTLGEEIARRGIRLIYGGGNIGLMGTIARAAHAAGGDVLSVIPRSLMLYEGADVSVGELILTDTLLERKSIMAQNADAFIAMPGGFGTLDELFEMITWAQLGVHTKPVGLLNVAGYYDPLLQMVDHFLAEGFIRERHKQLMVVDEKPASLLDQLASHQMPESLVKWQSAAGE